MENRTQFKLRRWLVKAFVLMMLSVIVVQTAPHQFTWTHAAKDIVSPVAKRLGLSQGEWNLFAPDPVLNNAWLSAEIYSPNGELTMWNSTYWGAASGIEKFRNFRMMNLGTRLHNRDTAAHEDFADYVARITISPTAHAIPIAAQSASKSTNHIEKDNGYDGTSASVWRLKLFRSQLRMTLPANGSLPTREDTIWISSSVQLVNREYLP